MIPGGQSEDLPGLVDATEITRLVTPAPIGLGGIVVHLDNGSIRPGEMKRNIR